MTLTTPAQERHTPFSCPNPHCARFKRPGAGNIAHRSWTGTSKHIERLRCTLCHREFSEREGPLIARSKLPEATVERLLKCQRWGVCDEGTADICAVDLKTVYHFQRVATQRAQPPHHWMRRMPNCDRHRWHGSRQRGRGGAGGCSGATLDHARRTRRLPCAHRSARVSGTCRCFSRRDGRPTPRRCSRSWASCIDPGYVGEGGVSRRPGAWRPKPASTPRGLRVGTKLAVWWRSAGGSWAAAPAAAASHDACASAVRRARRPAWNGGMAHGEAWSRPGGVAPDVSPGTGAVLADGMGSWGASPPL
jgi:hypothetical protein